MTALVAVLGCDTQAVTLAGFNVVQVLLLAWLADGPRRARKGRERRG